MPRWKYNKISALFTGLVLCLNRPVDWESIASQIGGQFDGFFDYSWGMFWGII